MLLPIVIVFGALPLFVLFPAPLADWASHLARVGVTEHVLHGDPFWTARYEYRGLLIPNAILDAVVLGGMRLGLSLDAAGAAFLALCYGCFVAGFVRLSGLSRLPITIAASVAIMLFYTGDMMFGLVNFVTGLGVAMLAASYCLQPNMTLGRRCLIAALATPVVLFCHLIAAGLLAAVLGAFALFAPSPSHAPGQAGRAWRVWALSLLPAVVAGIVTVIAYKLSAVSSDKPIIAWDGQPGPASIIRGKLRQVAEGLSSGSRIADAIMGAVILAVLCGLWRNRAHVRWWQLAVAASLATLPIIAPFQIGEGLLFDTRLFVVPLLIGLAILPWAGNFDPEWQIVIMIACTLRTLALVLAWIGYGPIYDHLRSEMARLPPGSALLSAYSDEPGFYAERQPPLHNVAALAVGGGVFVPSMWAEPSQQPLVIRPQWRPEWLWSHSANGRTPANLASVRERARRYCSLDPHTHLFILHVTEAKPFAIENECSTP